METPKTYLVAIEGEGGKVSTFRLKQWLRDHPAFIPLGMSARELETRLKEGRLDDSRDGLRNSLPATLCRSVHYGVR